MNEQGKPGISNRVWRAAATGRRGAVGMAAGLALALPAPALAEQVVAPRAVLASSFDLGALPAAATRRATPGWLLLAPRGGAHALAELVTHEAR